MNLTYVLLRNIAHFLPFLPYSNSYVIKAWEEMALYFDNLVSSKQQLFKQSNRE